MSPPIYNRPCGSGMDFEREMSFELGTIELTKTLPGVSKNIHIVLITFT